jgi:hypothetical protein
MKNILFVNLGNVNDCLISTSLIKELKREDNNITVLVKDKTTALPFRYNKKIDKILLIDKLPNDFSNIKFSTLYNFHPDFNKNTLNINCENSLGFNFSPDSFIFEKMLYYNQRTNKNIFQIYYNLVGHVWKGQGFDYCYYPKSKSKKNKVGIAIFDTKLRDYVMSGLNLGDLKLWYIPYKKNLFRQTDEINKCQYIITDDILSLNIALALRKETFFLQTNDFNYKIEMFGKGKVFSVPKFTF